MPQICDGQPFLYIPPVVQAEDPPLSCRTLIITIYLRGYGRQPPEFIDLLPAPIPTAFHHLLDQATYPPSPPSASPLSRLYTRLPLRALALTADSLKALGATNINSSNEEQPLSLAARTVVGVELEDGRLWATHPPKNRPWLDFN